MLECIDFYSGHENKDGYVRIWDKPKAQGGRLVMRHRWFWETFVSDIPDGYEIDHICKNRRCCNVDHLQMLTATSHRSKDNSERYLDRFIRFRDWYSKLESIPSQNAIAIEWGVSQSCISVWVTKINSKEVNK